MDEILDEEWPTMGKSRINPRPCTAAADSQNNLKASQGIRPNPAFPTKFSSHSAILRAKQARTSCKPIPNPIRHQQLRMRPHTSVAQKRTQCRRRPSTSAVQQFSTRADVNVCQLQNKRTFIQSAPMARGTDTTSASLTNAWMDHASPAMLLHRGASVNRVYHKRSCERVALPRLYEGIQGWLMHQAPSRYETKWQRIFVVFDPPSASIVQRADSETQQHVTVLDHTTEVNCIGWEPESGVNKTMFTWEVLSRRKNTRRLVFGCASREEAFEWMRQFRIGINAAQHSSAMELKLTNRRSKRSRNNNWYSECHQLPPTFGNKETNSYQSDDPRNELNSDHNLLLRLDTNEQTSLSQAMPALETPKTLVSSRTVDSGVSVSVLREVPTFDHVPVQQELRKHGMTLVRATRLHLHLRSKPKSELNSPQNADEQDAFGLQSVTALSIISPSRNKQKQNARTHNPNATREVEEDVCVLPEPKWKVVTIPEASASAIQSQIRGFLARKIVFGAGGLWQVLSDAANKLQRSWRSQLSRRITIRFYRLNNSAVFVQRNFRGWKIRKRYRHVVIMLVKAGNIQRWARCVLAARKLEALYVAQLAFATVHHLVTSVCVRSELRSILTAAFRKIVLKALVLTSRQHRSVVVLQRWMKRVHVKDNWRRWVGWQGFACQTIALADDTQATVHKHTASVVFQQLEMQTEMCGKDCTAVRVNESDGSSSDIVSSEGGGLRSERASAKEIVMSAECVVQVAKVLDIGSCRPSIFFQCLHTYETRKRHFKRETIDEETHVSTRELKWIEDSCECVKETWERLVVRASQTWADVPSKHSSMVHSYEAFDQHVIQPLRELDKEMTRLQGKHCSTLRIAVTFSAMAQPHAAQACIQTTKLTKETTVVVKQNALLRTAEVALIEHNEAVKKQLWQEIVGEFGRAFVNNALEQACVGFDEARNAVGKYFVIATRALLLKVKCSMLANDVTNHSIAMATRSIAQSAAKRVNQQRKKLIVWFAHTVARNYLSTGLQRAVSTRISNIDYLAHKVAMDVISTAQIQPVPERDADIVLLAHNVVTETISIILHRVISVRDASNQTIVRVFVGTLVASAISNALQKAVWIRDIAEQTVEQIQNHSVAQVECVQSLAALVVGDTILRVKTRELVQSAVNTIIHTALQSALITSIFAESVVNSAISISTISVAEDLEKQQSVEEHSDLVKVGGNEFGIWRDNGLLPNAVEQRSSATTNLIISQSIARVVEMNLVATTCVNHWMASAKNDWTTRRLVATDAVQYVLDVVQWNQYERDQQEWALTADGREWVTEEDQEAYNESKTEVEIDENEKEEDKYSWGEEWGSEGSSSEEEPEHYDVKGRKSVANPKSKSSNAAREHREPAQICVDQVKASKKYIESLLVTLHDGLSSSVSMLKHAACEDVNLSQWGEERHAPLYALDRVERAQEALRNKFDTDSAWACVELERHCQQALRRIRATSELIDSLQKLLGYSDLTMAPDCHRPLSLFTTNGFAHLPHRRRCHNTEELLSKAIKLYRAAVELRRDSNRLKRAKRRKAVKDNREYIRNNPLDPYRPDRIAFTRHDVAEKLIGFAAADAIAEGRIRSSLAEHLELGKIKVVETLRNTKLRWRQKYNWFVAATQDPRGERERARVVAATKIQKVARGFSCRQKIRIEKVKVIQTRWRAKQARRLMVKMARDIHEEMKDPVSGLTFYLNTKTGMTRWDLPAICAGKQLKADLKKIEK